MSPSRHAGSGGKTSPNPSFMASPSRMYCSVVETEEWPARWRILSAGSPRTAIHVMPVARRSWKVKFFRVASVTKSSVRVTPATRRYSRSRAAGSGRVGSGGITRVAFGPASARIARSRGMTLGSSAKRLVSLPFVGFTFPVSQSTAWWMKTTPWSR